MKRMKRWNFFISEPYLEQLRSHARNAEMSVSGFLRNIIQDFLKTKRNKLNKVWFRKGQESIKRNNKSGCCCILDDSDRVLSACEAHKEWREGL